MILSDKDIKHYLDEGSLSIEPLSDDTIRENGVDLRIGDEIMRFVYNNEPVDITDKNAVEKSYRKEKITDSFVVYPQERILIKIHEKIKMPNNLIGMCNVRSTFARLGLSIPPTIVDAGYEGNLTIMLIGGNVPVKVQKMMRFLHLVFSKTLSDVEKPYAGHYNKSSSVTGAKI
ncbi:MAG: deoxycytidine triphosphate deaminase [Candidatus Parvarchaeum acidophilus ARMAN-5]|jgi:dCTP deaminase|uniref:dCTP deaminase n=1 Tax=Candidatus Parvarchaeum acidophilus ARMAN-5 TaxID=662762 RepID=D6GWF7_PARA5|nr:MAG: deoxycytidine triphosphate deaminase [Candidatus Parvarchaeum acidophilus ARMAN-5]